MYRLLDLFCGAGGASMGYHRVGFEVVGVDIKPQPRYPFEFIQADALEVPLEGFDAIHASPPCQKFTMLKRLYDDREYKDLITPLREKVLETKLPYIIENVEGSPLLNPITLCGSMFNSAELRRHRWFECSFPVIELKCKHDIQTRLVGVYGRPGGKNPTNSFRKYGTKEDWKRVMDIDWMVVRELAQAIPPYYTEYIGQYLLLHLKGEN
jgi:DNA (cytosine-5)-methyltransferase 1